MFTPHSESCTVLLDSYGLIEPIVGGFIARAKVRTACRIAALPTDHVSCAEAEAFLAAFRKVCVQGVGATISLSLLSDLKCRCRPSAAQHIAQMQGNALD